MLHLASAVQTTTLTGVAQGQAALPKLKAAALQGHGAVVLDFADFELMTASAFREAILPLAVLLNNEGRTCVMVNANEVIREEAEIAAERSGMPLLFAKTHGSTLVDTKVVGALDEKLAITLDVVLKQGEADAKSVSEQSGESTVTTVWNNRLVALQKMGLLRERKVGKTKFYSPVVEGMSRGS